MTIRQPTAHYHRSQQQELAPLSSCLAELARTPTPFMDPADRRRNTLQHSCQMVQGSSSWPLWVDATDLCCPCDLMMMVMVHGRNSGQCQSCCHQRPSGSWSHCSLGTSPVTLTPESRPLHQKITPVQTSKVPFCTVSRASLRCECTALKGRIIFTSENLLWQLKTSQFITEEGAAEGVPVFRRQLQRVVNNSVRYSQWTTGLHALKKHLVVAFRALSPLFFNTHISATAFTLQWHNYYYENRTHGTQIKTKKKLQSTQIKKR